MNASLPRRPFLPTDLMFRVTALRRAAWRSVLLLAAMPVGASATDITAGDMALGFSVGNGSAGIATRYHVSDELALGLGLDYSRYESERVTETDERNSYLEYSRSRFTVSPSVRYYFAQDDLLWFVGGDVGLVYETQQNDTYTFYIDSASSRGAGELDGLGLGGSVYVGVETFFADQFSVEGRAGFSGSSVKVEATGDDGSISSDTRSDSEVSGRLFVNFYW